MGEAAPAGELTLRAILHHAAGQRLEWIRNGEVLATAAVPPSGELMQPVVARAGDWFSVVLRDATGPTLFGNAIYVRGAQ